MADEIGAVTSVPNISPSDIEGAEGDNGANSAAKEAEKARLEAKRDELQEQLERCRAEHNRSGPTNGNGDHQAKEAGLRSQISTIDGQISQLE